ncbi:hypothetical protein CH364_18610, partial [Leptospira harrisiae]
YVSSDLVEQVDGKFRVRTCFVAGTKIHTKEGLKNIEDIRVGDVVLSKSDETGEVSYRKVVNTFIRQTEAIYTVSFADGTVLETTWNHPFRVKKQGHALEKFSIETTDWVQAKDLHPGDVALGAEGQELVVTDITIDERVETVYNFEVEEYHTYFVGEVGVWVHNDAALYVAFPNTQIAYKRDSDDNNKTTTLVGHAGIILVDDMGNTEYHEFGRYRDENNKPTQGLIKSQQQLPKIEFTLAGDPKPESVGKVLGTISKMKEGDNIEAVYIPLNDGAFKKMSSFVTNQKEKYTNPDNRDYDTFSNNCSTFARKTIEAGGGSALMPLAISPAPVTLIKQLRISKDSYIYDGQKSEFQFSKSPTDFLKKKANNHYNRGKYETRPLY